MNITNHSPTSWGDSCGLLPSVAQPPLPLQEFFPLQPLSLVLHPPLPLQEFLPSHECLSVASFLPICNATPGFAVETEAWVVATNDPLINPAIAAPAITAFFVICGLSFLFFCSSSRRHYVAPRRSTCTLFFLPQHSP